MQLNDIAFEKKGAVATITFNRPEYGNSFSENTYVEVPKALAIVESDPGIHALIITGAGKHFCAGGDINRFKRQIDSKKYLEKENIMRAGRMAAAISKCPKPTIAMINGAAAGAGCAVALACDFRVGAVGSKLIMAFIKMGLSGDTGCFYYLQSLVGAARAKQLMMLGDVITGEEAYSMGLLTLLADEGSLQEETDKLALRLAAGPAAAYARQKAIAAEFFQKDMQEYLVKEALYMEECSRTEDFEEAVNSFLEKRTPVFKGR